jgi:hypothetical protein
MNPTLVSPLTSKIFQNAPVSNLSKINKISDYQVGESYPSKSENSSELENLIELERKQFRSTKQ